MLLTLERRSEVAALVETPPTLNIVYFPRFGKHNHSAEAFVLCCKVSVKQFVESPI